MRDRDKIDGRAADMNRHWCAYTELEEYHAGMWRVVTGHSQDALIAESVSILRNPDKFDDALSKVLNEWPVSCKAEFTSPGNHLAWCGQAACCIERGVPEALTRRAWWKLTESERDTANRIAASMVDKWRCTSQVKQLRLPCV